MTDIERPSPETPSPENPSAYQAMVEQVLAAHGPALAAWGETLADDPFTTAVLDQLRGGPTVRARLGLTDAHIDALLAQGHALLCAGQPARARELFGFVVLVDPYEHRALYAHAASFQIDGDHAAARVGYMSYLAQRPLEARGYVRIAECLAHGGHVDEAAEYIEGAIVVAEDNNDTATAQEARALLSTIRPPAAAV